MGVAVAVGLGVGLAVAVGVGDGVGAGVGAAVTVGATDALLAGVFDAVGTTVEGGGDATGPTEQPTTDAATTAVANARQARCRIRNGSAISVQG